MFGFGKGKKIEKLVAAIGDTLSGQTMRMPISSGEFISLSKSDKLISGYIMGFQLRLVTSSQFKEDDHRSILIDSYYHFFGSDDAQDIIDYSFSNKGDETYTSGVVMGFKDIDEFAKDPKNSPLGLLRILYDKQEADEIRS